MVGRPISERMQTVSGYWLSELEDGTCVACQAFEITAIPLATRLNQDMLAAIRSNTATFLEMLISAHGLSGMQDTVLELLFATVPAVRQIYAAQIRIFLILRKYGEDPSLLAKSMRMLANNLRTSLEGGHYTCQEKPEDDEDFRQLLSGIRMESVYQLERIKKLSQSYAYGGFYGYADPFPIDSTHNYNRLLDALSKHSHCAVSIQLIPTVFTPAEYELIRETAFALNRCANGYHDGHTMIPPDASLELPAKWYNGLLRNLNKPLFLFNILVMGLEHACADLIGKLQMTISTGKPENGSTDLSAIRLECAGDYREELPVLPWNIASRAFARQEDSASWKMWSAGDLLNRVFNIATAEEACAFFRLPIDDRNVVGLRSNAVLHTKEQLPPDVMSEESIPVGRLEEMDARGIEIGIPLKCFTKHALIVGMPGTGKTTFSIKLLLDFWTRGIPFLAIEPTKSEYRAMIDAIPSLQVFTPGKNRVVPFVINPFIPPEGIELEVFIPSLASAFKAAFSMPPPLDILFLKAVNECYLEHGWRAYTKFGDPEARIFGLHEFILVFRRIIRESTYSGESKGNLESAGVFRLMNLIEQNASIYDTVHSVPIRDLLQRPTVLELNAIENREQKALLMALLLIHVVLHTKQNQAGDGKLKNILLIDEAHVLLAASPEDKAEDAADASGSAVRAVQDMIVEIRSYGTGIIIADQSPGKVTREVVGNTDVKMMFRLVQREDKRLIADATNMSDLDEGQLSRLHPGQAYVYYANLPEPQLIITEDVRKRDNIRLVVQDAEIAARSQYWKGRQALLRPYPECEYAFPHCEQCDSKIRADARYAAERVLRAMAPHLKSKESFINVSRVIDKYVRQVIPEGMTGEALRIFLKCTKAQLLRGVSVKNAFAFSAREYRAIIAGGYFDIPGVIEDGANPTDFRKKGAPDTGI